MITHFSFKGKHSAACHDREFPHGLSGSRRSVTCPKCKEIFGILNEAEKSIKRIECSMLPIFSRLVTTVGTEEMGYTYGSLLVVLTRFKEIIAASK